MTSTPFILYFIGLIGIFISIILFALKSKKSVKITNSISIGLFIISLVTLLTGTFFALKDINNINNDKVVNPQIDTIRKKPSIAENIEFSYKIYPNVVHNMKQISLEIINCSSKNFNGILNLKFKNKDNSIVSSMEIPIINLSSTRNYTPLITVDAKIKSLSYDISGTFNKSDETFSIPTMAMGDNSLVGTLYLNKKSKIQDVVKTIHNQIEKSSIEGYILYLVDDIDKSYANAYGELHWEKGENKYNLNIY